MTGSTGSTGSGLYGRPLADLRLRCGPVSLRPVTEADVDRLATVLPSDVRQDPARERFGWLSPEADARRHFRQSCLRAAGSWSPASWVLHLAVETDGELVGVQTLEGDDFADLRTVDTASWLVADARGRGLGVAMRTAVLGLAFDHLRAEVAVSSAAVDNQASLGVSRRLGYRDDGVGRVREDDRVVDLVRLRLTRADWRFGADVEVVGVDTCFEWFGAEGGRR